MTTYFLDSSALVKRYIPEVGSHWVRGLCRPAKGHIITISELAIVEVVSAFARRWRENPLLRGSVASMEDQFLSHVDNQYLSVELDTVVLKRARVLTTQYTLRTLDAIQLASAVHAYNLLDTTITFVGADVKLLAFAASEGFAVENPTRHP